MQGFVPALIAREILIRSSHVAGRPMSSFLCICIAKSICACYELIELGAAQSPCNTMKSR
jgi:putative membrane protein